MVSIFFVFIFTAIIILYISKANNDIQKVETVNFSWKRFTFNTTRYLSNKMEIAQIIEWMIQKPHPFKLKLEIIVKLKLIYDFRFE